MPEEPIEQNPSPEELNAIKIQYNNAKKLLENISTLASEYNQALSTLKTTQDQVERISNDSRERFGTIDNAKNDSAKLIAEIKSNLEKTSSSIETIDEGLRKFENIKGKIEGRDGEIEALVSTANGLRNDIEKAKSTALQKLADIDGLLVQVQQKIDQMQKAYESFISIQGKIIDPKTGLEAILAHSNDLQKRSNELFAEINSFRDDSKGRLLEIQNIKADSENLKNQIGTNLETVKSQRTEVEKITALITDTGFANSFQKREKTLRYSAIVWLSVLVISILSLALLLYYLFKDVTGVPEWQVILHRFTLTSPLIFLIGFAMKQYSNERHLNERYAFKATIAVVLRNHADFIFEKTTDENAENSNFIRRTIENLYSEPFDKGDDIKKMKKELKSFKELQELVGKDTEKGMRISNLLDKTKELKAIISDEATFKKILDLLKSEVI